MPKSTSKSGKDKPKKKRPAVEARKEAVKKKSAKAKVAKAGKGKPGKAADGKAAKSWGDRDERQVRDARAFQDDHDDAYGGVSLGRHGSGFGESERCDNGGAGESAGKAAGKNAGKAAGAGKRKKAAGGAASRGKHAMVQPADSLCPVSAQCGACANIDVAYDAQLHAKQDQIVDLFYDLAGDECTICFIKGMEDPFHYRNKIISPFVPGRKRAASGKGKGAKQTGREILTGMYIAGTHRLVDTSACLLENPVGQKVIRAVKQLMGKFGVEAYDEDTGQGFMRHVVVRIGHNSGEVLVTLVTNQREFPGAKGFARELVKRVPQITTVVQNVNMRQTNVILGDEEHVIYGPGFILDTLCGLSFRISSTSFYQVSAGQTQVLYQTAIDFAKEAVAGLAESARAEGRRLTVMDAYCGTGTIGLVAASQMGNSQVIGVDSVARAIADAKLNAKHNGIENAEFVAADAGEFMRQRAAEGLALDVLFMDPPRAGSDEAFLSSAVESAPQAIVYISCNPVTQARDVRYLIQHGYVLKVVQPVDMFPHTQHIECVTLLVKDAFFAEGAR